MPQLPIALMQTHVVAQIALDPYTFVLRRGSATPVDLNGTLADALEYVRMESTDPWPASNPTGSLWLALFEGQVDVQHGDVLIATSVQDTNVVVRMNVIRVAHYPGATEVICHEAE